MRMHDVNIFVYAHRTELPEHPAAREVLAGELVGEQSYAVADTAINGFVRVVTDKRIFKTPSTLSHVLAFADQIRHASNAIVVSPGRRHWAIFERLCEETGASGRLVPDAYLAALAIEHGCEFVTADKRFQRFRGLRVQLLSVGEQVKRSARGSLRGELVPAEDWDSPGTNAVIARDFGSQA